MTWGKRGQTSLNVADRLPRYVRAVASAAPRIDIVRFIPVFIFLLTVISLVVSAMSFTILYTNDIHNRLGSLASLSALIERERVNDAPVLLFDSGDTWHDFRVPLYAVWGADEMVAWMNRVNYDAMAIGNHDLYYGADKLAELSSKADFPVLCSNMVPFAGEQAPYASYTIIDAAGMRVLVVGVITAEYLSYPDYPWLEYVDPAQAIQGILDEMRGKYDFVIVLGHLPMAQAVLIARSVPDIDVFLTGHSHEVTPQPVKQGKTLIVQAGAFGQYLGRLKLEIDPESREVASAQNSLLKTKKTPVDLDRGFVKVFAVVALIATSLFLLIR